MGTSSLRRVPAIAALLLAGPVAGQVSWQPQNATPRPSARENHCGAYDIGRGRLVIHGGQLGGTTLSDTWEYDGTAWQQMAVTTSPGPRWAASMAYDPATSTTILFGGSNTSSGTPLADTWRWNGTTWTLLQPAQSPSALLAHAMTADLANNRIVLFGGRNQAGMHVPETWTFDGTTWTQLPGPQPPARCCHDLAYDLAAGSVLLFGGWAQLNLGDTWELAGNAWVQRTPPQSPSARWGHRMTLSLSLGRIVLHGNSVATSANDTWAWNGTTWQLVPLAAPYAPVVNPVLESEWSSGRVVMFGGSSMSTPTDAVRTLLVAAPGSFVPSGAGCAGPAGTPQLSGVGFPWIGRTLVLRAQPVPLLGVFVLGASNTMSGTMPLPLSLAPIGMPGCTLQVSLDTVRTGTVSGGAAQLSLPLPLNPALVGIVVHAQAGSFDAAANALGLTISNAVAVQIGGV